MVTRADVARHAGVAPSTVSYALNGGRSISESTRERIQAAMTDLGYSPNAMAAGLAGGRSHLLAMLLPSTDRRVSDSDLAYLIAAGDEARRLGYELILLTTERHDLADIGTLHRRGLTDGVLLMDVLLEDVRVTMLQQAGIPFALIGRTADPDLPHADRDFEQDAHVCVDHLVGLGHRYAGLITSPERSFTKGYGAVVRPVEALRGHASSAGLHLTLLPCEATVDAGREALASLRAHQPDATAVISLIDEATMGVYHEAQAKGLTIPDDLSVISMTVSPQRGAFFSPGLTAIGPPARAIGRAAARALINELSPHNVNPGPTLWTGVLVDNGSTAPARRTSS